MDFLYNYVRSMRLYYCFVTGSTVMAGLVIGSASNNLEWKWSILFCIIAGYLIWGINQIVNDWEGLKEDRINAPHRPMVCNKLPVLPALLLSAILDLIIAVVICFIDYYLLIPLFLGIVLNSLYSITKGIPILGCLVYGAAISCCLLFGFLLSKPGQFAFPENTVFWFVIYVLIHALMCHFSYFKDIQGDRDANKRTLQVTIGIKYSFWLIEIPAIFFLLFYWHRLYQAGNYPLLVGIIISASLFALMSSLIITGNSNRVILGVCVNCMLCTSLCLLPIIAIKPEMWLLIPVSLLSIIFLIKLFYTDEKE